MQSRSPEGECENQLEEVSLNSYYKYGFEALQMLIIQALIYFVFKKVFLIKVIRFNYASPQVYADNIYLKMVIVFVL